MNYTENYHLPQWEETDRVLRTDFNNAMDSIETGLTLSYSPDNPLYTVGTYTGDGANQKITLGFKPQFVIVSGVNSSTTGNFFVYMGVASINHPLRSLSFEEDGFHVWDIGSPLLNTTDHAYTYIAFR